MQDKVLLQTLGSDYLGIGSDPFKKGEYATSGSIIKNLKSPGGGLVQSPGGAQSERSLESDQKIIQDEVARLTKLLQEKKVPYKK